MPGRFRAYGPECLESFAHGIGPSKRTLVLALLLGVVGAAVGYQVWEEPGPAAPPP